MFLSSTSSTDNFHFPITFTHLTVTLCTLSTAGSVQNIGWSVIYIPQLWGFGGILRHYFNEGDYNILSIGY